MSNISFNEEPSIATRSPVSREPLFIRVLIAWGIVKTPKAAQVLLLCVILLCVVAAIWAFPKGRPAPSENIPVAGPSAAPSR